MRKSPLLSVLFGISVVISLACVGGRSEPMDPSKNWETFVMMMYCPDVVASGEPFDATITAYKDPALGASNRPVNISGHPFKCTPSTFPVEYPEGSNSYTRTVRVETNLEKLGAFDLFAERQNPVGRLPRVKRSITILPFRATMDPIDVVRLAPGERTAIDLRFTTTAFRPNRARIELPPSGAYSFQLGQAEFEVPVGVHQHSTRLTIVASDRPTSGVSEIFLIDLPAGQVSPSITRGRLEFRVPSDRRIELQVTPEEVTLFPNTAGPLSTITAIGHGGFSGTIDIENDTFHYMTREPATDPFRIFVPANGRGTQNVRWTWGGATSTPPATVITYRALVDGKEYTATQTVRFRREG